MSKFKLFIIVAFILTSCHPFLKKTNSLVKFIDAGIRGNTGIIDLRKYTAVEWDHFYVLTPYTSERELNVEMKKYDYMLDETSITYLDSKYVFVFFNKDELVSYEEIKRTYLFNDEDYRTTTRPGIVKPFYKNKVQLTYIKNPNGGYFLHTAPK